MLSLARRRSYVLLSNSTAPDIAGLYENDHARSIGLVAHRVAARRAVNSNPSGRGPVEKYLITNINVKAEVGS
jgi:hypothetical protein